MRPYTARLLYRYVPVVITAFFAVCYVALPFVVTSLNTALYWLGTVIVAGLEGCLYLLRRIGRYKEHAAEEAYLMTLILGGLGYLLPSILFLFIPLWIVLSLRVEQVLRTLAASLLGVITVAVIGIALTYFCGFPCRWLGFFSPPTLVGWIAIGYWALARACITMLRQSLHVR